MWISVCERAGEQQDAADEVRAFTMAALAADFGVLRTPEGLAVGTLLRRLAMAVFLAAWSLPLCAQGTTEGEEWKPRRGTSKVLGFGYQIPEGPELAAGLIVGSVPGRRNKCIFGATSEGLLLQAHAGLNGGKLSVGAARYTLASATG